MMCLACGKHVEDHKKWTEADVFASERATFSRPIRVPSGPEVYSPLSPVVIGEWIGHDPMPSGRLH